MNYFLYTCVSISLGLFGQNAFSAPVEIDGILWNTPEHSVQVNAGSSKGEGYFINLILRSETPLKESGLYALDHIPGFSADTGIFYLFTKKNRTEKNSNGTPPASAWRVSDSVRGGIYERVYQFDLSQLMHEEVLKGFLKGSYGFKFRMMTSIKLNQSESGFDDYNFTSSDFFSFNTGLTTDRCQKIMLGN